MLGPVAVPAFVPTFDQHAVEAVLGGEVDVALGVRGGGAVLFAGAPGRFVEVHFPPDADVLAGLDPAGVGELAGLVEIENQVGRDQFARIVADLDRSPGRVMRQLWRGLSRRPTRAPGRP